jgi:hypothetical protein
MVLLMILIIIKLIYHVIGIWLLVILLCKYLLFKKERIAQINKEKSVEDSDQR